MKLWAIKHVENGAYLRNRDTEIMIFTSPEAAKNHISSLPNPKLYCVVEFRR